MGRAGPVSRADSLNVRFDTAIDFFVKFVYVYMKAGIARKDKIFAL